MSTQGSFIHTEMFFTPGNSSNLVKASCNAMAKHSSVIKDMLNDVDSGSEQLILPGTETSEFALRKLVEFCEHYESEKLPEEVDKKPLEGDAKYTITEWDTEFMNFDYKLHMEVMAGANFYDVVPMKDLISKVFANYVKDHTVEEIREAYGIVNDFTPEEEAAAKEENKWYDEN